MRGGVVFGPGGTESKYRYLLSRAWGDPEGVRVTWLMLNPSTATATKHDPTIHQCMYFSRREGYEGIYVVNLFALRSPDPALIFSTPFAEAVGPENNKWIRYAVSRTASTIVAWGNNGIPFPKRREQVLKYLRTQGTIRCLGLTGRGQPRHPARLSRDTKLEEF